MDTVSSVELDRFVSALALRHFRLSQGWSRREMGERLGFSDSTPPGCKSPSSEIVVYRWENEICRVSAENLEKIILLAGKHNWNFHRYANLCCQFRLYGKINDHEVTRLHALNVSELVEDLGRLLQIPNLAKAVQTGAMHDIGKSLLKEGILNKPERLSAAEEQEMMQHPDWSFIQLQGIDGEIALWARHHHERWLGKKARGYPEGLQGDEIPYESRIIAICDSWDAMTADRPYRKGMDFDSAWKQILKGSGTEFDPELVKAFAEIARKWKESREAEKAA